MLNLFLGLQIVIAVVLITVTVIQHKGGGLGGLMGGGQSGGVFRTRRGLERILFRFTIAWGTFFVLFSMITIRLAQEPPV
jgi:preprotein translocase subunit SecG